MMSPDMGVPPSKRYLGEVVLRRYMIDKLVGEGSFAWVYRARSRDGELVAVKVLHSDQPTASVRFIREIRVLQALPTNPFVAGYIDHGHSRDGKPLMVLEYVDGITLKLGLERRPHLSTEKAVAYLAELCQAFVELHQLGVAHRDVKPENILMTRTGEIKLIDFGLIRDAQGLLKLLEKDDPLAGRVFEEELDRGVIAGTPEYMAPEQFSDSALDDTAQTRTNTSSDIFSLGVILFELLTGRKPFPMREVPRAEYPRELLRYLRWRIRLRDKDLPPLPGVDAPLQSVVRKALRRDPRRRQPDARALIKDLQRYQLEGRGVAESDDSRTMVASMAHGQVLSIMNAARQAPPPTKQDGQGPSLFSFEEDTHVNPGARASSEEVTGTGHTALFFERGNTEEAPESAGEDEPTGDLIGAEDESYAVPGDSTLPAEDNPMAEVRSSPEMMPGEPWPTENLADLGVDDHDRGWQRSGLEDIVGIADQEAWPSQDEEIDPHDRDTGRISAEDLAVGIRESSPDVATDGFGQYDDIAYSDTLRRFGNEGITAGPSRSGGDPRAVGLREVEIRSEWPVENLADPPREGEPEVFRAPTDAPSLGADSLFDELDIGDSDDELGLAGLDEESAEVNLADLLPKSKDRRKR